MLTQPKQHWLIFTLLAVVTAFIGSQLDQYWRGLFGTLTMIFIFAAAAFAMTFAGDKLAAWYRDIINSRNETAGVRMLKIIATMTPEQLEVVKLGAAEIDLQGGFPEPQRYLIMYDGKERISYQFIEDQFLRRSTDVYLCSINTFSDGTQEREWSRRFTSLMVKNGFAKAANGNEPAKWLDRDQAMEWLGIR